MGGAVIRSMQGKRIVAPRRDLSLGPHRSVLESGREAAAFPEHPGFQGFLGSRAAVLTRERTPRPTQKEERSTHWRP